jgi:hypothetical protein
MWRWWAILLLIVLIGAWSVRAQTDTPTPGPSPTPTFDLNVYVTVIPPGGTLMDAQGGAIKFEVDAGEAMIAMALVLLILLALFDLVLRYRGKWSRKT